jgi:hypothetical protein
MFRKICPFLLWRGKYQSMPFGVKKLKKKEDGKNKEGIGRIKRK